MQTKNKNKQKKINKQTNRTNEEKSSHVTVKSVYLCCERCEYVLNIIWSTSKYVKKIDTKNQL